MSGDVDMQVVEGNPSEQDNGVSTTSLDPASSLRAAALKTLKSKRRKPAQAQASTSGSRSRVQDQSVQLDYGQEDSGATVTTDTAIMAAKRVGSNSPRSEDGHAREEGEISDEGELEQDEAMADAMVEDGEFGMKQPASPGSVASTASIASSSNQAARSKPLLARISTAPIPFASAASVSPVESSPTHLVESPVSEESFEVDENHARPGLAMTTEQYLAAKDIILDLLGWGVSPDYLLDCGLSRHIIFHVFHEFNLRLPERLDTTGLAPYFPEKKVSPASNSPATSSSHRPRSVSSPVPPTSQSARLVQTSQAARHSLAHPSLPARPSQQVLASAEAAALSKVPSSQTSPSFPLTDASLHDMEQQRRQELLARKAVQASRKQRTSESSDGANGAHAKAVVQSTVNDLDVEMTSTVPRETVDDFLKSIGQESTATSDKGKGVDRISASGPHTTSSHGRSFGHDEMDVDEIPGFITSMHTPSVSAPVEDKQPNGFQSSSLLPSVDGPPPVSGVSEATSYISTAASDGVTSGESLSGDDSRRYGRRPVAADFVDFESRPSSANGNGFSNGHGGPALLRRKAASFASVSGMRRCIIDVSDSEDDEGSEDELGRKTLELAPSGQHLARSGSTTGVTGSLNGSRNTPPASGMTPAALMEKEREIKLMREKIAKREQSLRKKNAATLKTTSKVAAVASISGMPSSLGAAISAEVTDVKVEETATPILTPPSSGTLLAQPELEQEVTQAEPVEDDATPKRPALSYSDSMIPVPDDAEPASANTSASDVATPTIDNILAPSRSVSSDIQVFTAEAQHEDPPVDRSSPEAFEDTLTRPDFGTEVDILTVEAARAPLSAEQPLPEQHPPTNRFTSYDSLFHMYPLLRSGLHAAASPLTTSVFLPSSPSLASFSPLHAAPDLKPLKMQVLLKSVDPATRFCQYEVPGGGVCKDAQCEDVHLSRLGATAADGVPDDYDTAQYLRGTYPQYSAQAILGALQQSSKVTDLESKVASALEKLQVDSSAAAAEADAMIR